MLQLRGIYNRIMGSQLLHEDDEDDQRAHRDPLSAWRQRDPERSDLQAKDEELFMVSGEPDDDMGGYDGWISVFPASQGEGVKKEALQSKEDAEILPWHGMAARLASASACVS